jgi:hypothetical protein
VYDDAIAMRTWLEEAIRTELFGPTFENSGPWQLMKSSRRGWIAPQVSRHVSEESGQSLALMRIALRRDFSSLSASNSATAHMDTHKGVQEGTITPNTDGSPARSKTEKQFEICLPRDFLRLSASNSATEHMDTQKGVQEGTITPIIDGSPARSKTKKQLEMEGQRDFIQERAIQDEEWTWSADDVPLIDFASLSASNSATTHMDIQKGVQEGTITPNTDGSPARSKTEKQFEICLPRDFLRLSASNSATKHMDTHKGVQEGTITPIIDDSPARSKTEKQLEMEGQRDFIQKCAIQECKWSPGSLLSGFSSLSAINSATVHMDTQKGVQEGTITPIVDGSPARSKTEKQLEMEGQRDFIQERAIQDEEWTRSADDVPLIDFTSLSASNSATAHMDIQKGVQEGTITPNRDGSPAWSRTEKQLEMEGHRDFIQECDVEDEMWKWSPLYLFLRDFSLLSTHLPRPWKHTAEEWDSVLKFSVMNPRFTFKGHVPLIVKALAGTWTLHFDENIENVDLNKLPDQLEHLSQEKEFGNNLSRLQRTMLRQFALESQEQQILANDIASFKATSESPGHQEVIKRVCNHFVGIAHEAMEGMMEFGPQKNVKEMWIEGHLECDRETLIKLWNDTLSQCFVLKQSYGVGIINLFG